MAVPSAPSPNTSHMWPWQALPHHLEIWARTWPPVLLSWPLTQAHRIPLPLNKAAPWGQEDRVGCGSQRRWNAKRKIRVMFCSQPKEATHPIGLGWEPRDIAQAHVTYFSPSSPCALGGAPSTHGCHFNGSYPQQDWTSQCACRT